MPTTASTKGSEGQGKRQGAQEASRRSGSQRRPALPKRPWATKGGRAPKGLRQNGQAKMAIFPPAQTLSPSSRSAVPHAGLGHHCAAPSSAVRSLPPCPSREPLRAKLVLPLARVWRRAAGRQVTPNQKHVELSTASGTSLPPWLQRRPLPRLLPARPRAPGLAPARRGAPAGSARP